MVLLLTSAAGVRISAQAAGAQGRTVWDGVYTDAQAARATGTFNQVCSNCHTLAAQGNKPLSGEKFWEGFTQKTVGDLLTYVKTNMPNGNGGSLSASSYNDLVALILQVQRLPDRQHRARAGNCARLFRSFPGMAPENYRPTRLCGSSGAWLGVEAIGC